MWRSALLITLCLLACHSAAASGSGAPAPAKSRTNVRGHVFLTTQTYCGGARPSEDRPLSKREPEPGRKLLVRRGSQNSESEVVAQIKSDASGAFALSLRPGTYCFVEEAKREVSHSGPPAENVDAACMDNWRRTCDAVLEVPETGEASVAVELYKGCQGQCSEGPFPP